MTDKIKRRK